MFWTLTLVAAGGAIGSVLRFLTISATGAPVGTLIVNVVGSLFMGILFALIAHRSQLSLFLMTGVLGGFTTFSAFSLDVMRLWQTGQGALAFGYAAASTVISVAAVFAGAALARMAVA